MCIRSVLTMFGDDDFFNEIERAFFGGSRRLGGSHAPVHEEQSMRDSSIFSSSLHLEYDRVEAGKKYFVIVNFFEKVDERDLEVTVEDDFEGSGNWLSSSDKVLSIVNKAKNNSFCKIKIPKKVGKMKFDVTLNNGIMEVVFAK